MKVKRVNTGTGAKRSRGRRDGSRATNGLVPSKSLRKAHLRLEKRQAAYDALSLDKKQKCTRPGSMKTRTN